MIREKKAAFQAQRATAQEAKYQAIAERTKKLKEQNAVLGEHAKARQEYQNEKRKLSELKYGPAKEKVRAIIGGINSAAAKAKANRESHGNSFSLGSSGNGGAFRGAGFQGFGTPNKSEPRKKARYKEKIIIIR